MKYFIFLLCTLFLAGCQKYLAEKPNKKLNVPASLGDLQALMDDYNNMNNQGPLAGEVSADNYYVNDNDFDAIYYDSRRHMYLWDKDHLFENQFNDWFNIYASVYSANTVLEKISAVERTAPTAAQWDNVCGQAQFFRAYNFYEAVSIWSAPWDAATAATDLGIPLRLSTNFNKPSVRASVADCYKQVVTGLETAATLLPVTPVSVYRPSRPAAYGTLARVFLSMRLYDSARHYAALCLQDNNNLLDYNSLNAGNAYPFTPLNREVIFERKIPSDDPLFSYEAKIDSSLLASYKNGDLRKALFFSDNGDGTAGFKGSYETGDDLFGGIATDEMYLIMAEAAARANDLSTAMQDLNTLLAKRWTTTLFVPLQAANQQVALNLVLQERRKELLMRGLRWMDLKRFNKEGMNITLHRFVHGQFYTLSPNDPRYILPLPDDVISLSGMPQNPR